MIKSNSKKAIDNVKKYIVEHTTHDTDCVNENLIKDFLKWKKDYNVNLEYTSDNNGAYFNLTEKGVIA